MGENGKSGIPVAGGKITAGTYFKNQLSSLVTTLNATSTHYVRCIKPNTAKAAFSFDQNMVLCKLNSFLFFDYF
jgi:myosin V